MPTTDWYPFRRHPAMGTDGVLRETGELEIFDAETGVPVEVRAKSAYGQPRGSGAVMGTVPVTDFATHEFEARAIEVYGQSGDLAPVQMSSPEGVAAEAAKKATEGLGATWEEIAEKPDETVLTGGDGITVTGATISVDPAGWVADLAATALKATIVAGTTTADSQAAFDVGGLIHYRAGTYDVDSVSVTKSVWVTCEPGVVFRRAAGADTAQGSYWAAGAAMFEVDTPGVTVDFLTPFTYDGNNTNQPTTEPTGFFLKTYPTATPGTTATRVRITGGRFINGTSGYLCLRGDDVQRRYDTRVILDDCTFTDTIHGVGKGDPATPNPLGFLPNYVLVYDHVTLITRDFTATWDKTNGTGQYAACAINGTFYGTDSATSGECNIYMYGTTYLRGMGRSGKKWDNDADYATNNGIGAIDVYGNGGTLHVEHVVADDCENVPVRAKASLRNYTVGSATLTNCHRGLQVSPSTTGLSETVVKVGSVTSYGGTIPQVEFNGSSTADVLPSVTIESAHITGTLTNPEALITEGAVYLRNTRSAKARNVTVKGAPTRGVSVVAVDHATLRGVTIDGTGTEGLFTSGGGTLFELDDFTVKNTGGYAVSLSGNTTRNTVTHGVIDNGVGYGLFSNNTTDLTVVDVAASTITGSPSRAFYAAGGDAAFIHCKSGAGVMTALTTGAGTRRREDHNSWNPAVTWGSAYTTTIGTAERGDQVWNLSPTAGGPLGWVCITAGSPGVWKTFGGVAA